MSAQQAILNGFDPELSQPHLRFGDTISLIPKDVNGIVAFAGSGDGRPWVEKLTSGVGTPPNLRDCQFKLLPRRQYAESKALQKLVKRGSWDGGRNLPLPPVPPEGSDCEKLAKEFATTHKIENRPSTKEVFQQLIAAAEEHEGNISEEGRQQKSVIHYGDAIQLMHMSTGMVPTVSKQQAIERGSKKVEMVLTGDDTSVFEVVPAYKSYSNGDPVSSGDLMVLRTKKRISGLHYSLHMSAMPEMGASQQRAILRQLQVESDTVQECEEVNATTGDYRETAWRALLFSPAENLKEHSERFKAEDVVCFYHKEAEAYLDFNPNYGMGPVPTFRVSRRVAVKARKKSSWMWKIENLETVNAAGQVQCGDQRLYRIKHLASNLYLKTVGERLEVTADYTDPATLFGFRNFAKDAPEHHALLHSMVYVRAGCGAWLTQDGGADGFGRKGDTDKDKSVLMRNTEFVSERDAVLIIPLAPAAVAAVVQIRRAVSVIRDYGNMLEQIPAQKAPADAVAPRELPSSAQEVLRETEEVFDGLVSTLKVLILNCTFDEEPDPMSKDGIPNRLLQKLLREMHAVSTVMRVVQLPFARGVALAWMEHAAYESGPGKDKRFERLLYVLRLCYRLMKQVVKQDDRNAAQLYQHIDVIRAHLGRGLMCEVTLREIFFGTRHLLTQIDEDLIQQIVDLLKVRKDPRYIDFLLSICTCGDDPMPGNQALIVNLLLRQNPDLLPQMKLERSGGRLRLGIHVPGTMDAKNLPFWIDVAKYKDVVIRGGYPQDLAGYILTAAPYALDDQQKLFRYFIRCTNLFGKLVFGRNQQALGELLNSEALCFKYAEILAVMREPSIPALVRARFTALMMNFYVDRDPQSSSPQILYTRAWSKVNPEPSDLQPVEAISQAIAPTCETGFVDLLEYLLEELPRLGTDKGQVATLNSQPTFGQLELLNSLLTLTDLLVDFGFFLSDRNTVNVDYTKIKQLSAVIFTILDTSDTTPKPSKKKELVMLADLRNIALRLLLRFFNLRADFRISLATSTWEDIFEQLFASGSSSGKKFLRMGSNMLQAISSATRRGAVLEQEQRSFLRELFTGSEKYFSELEAKMLSQDIVTSDKIGADRYTFGKHAAGDVTVERLVGLFGYHDVTLSQSACSLLFRNMAQRARVVEDLRQVQMLVFPAAIKVYHETEKVIKELTALKKSVSVGKAEALARAGMLLERMAGYLLCAGDTSPEIVRKNQKIMLNRELDEPVVDLLRLNLERDTSRRDQQMRAGGDADVAKDEAMKQLFQQCYDFLRALTDGNERAQKKLFPLIETFSDHMGIKELNVADTISAIVKDNPALCQQVSESTIRKFTDAIKIWGRKARWLAFFQVFVEVKGRPFKRTQDMVLRILLEDRDVLLDLTCDYTNSEYLPKTDERYGKSRVDLLAEGEHKRRVGSLLKYHFTSINLLALCAAGKNPVAKPKIFPVCDFDHVVDHILDIDRRPDGTQVEVKDRDALHYIKQAWMRLMRHVYLTAHDTVAVKKVQKCKRLWFTVGKAGGTGLVGEFQAAVQLLRGRLEALPDGEWQLANADGLKPLVNVEDALGTDLGCHVSYVEEVLEAATSFYGRTELYEEAIVASKGASTEQLSKELSNEVILLYRELRKKKLIDAAHKAEGLIAEIANRGVGGARFLPEPDEEEGLVEVQSKEAQFSEGWTNFCARLADAMKVSTSANRNMDDGVKDLALLFGSRRTRNNETLQALRHLMELLCEPDCEVFVRLNGLKMVRAVLFLQPQRKDRDKDAVEADYQRFLTNKPPADARRHAKEFIHLQVEMARLGAVDVVVSCLSSSDMEVVYAALQLAVTLLEGGNAKVQDMFAETLLPASSQAFFSQLQKLFTDSVEGLKEAKRKEKQKEAAAAYRTGKTIRTPETEETNTGNGIYMTEVMKMMRRMCMGQHHGLQNVLRRQRLNRTTIDFFDAAVTYLIALEPELKKAIQEEDEDTVESAIRGFLMLSDAMHGPNYENQTAIANTGVFDLGDRIFTKIRYEDTAGFSRTRKGKAEGGSETDVQARNRLRTRLKQAVVTCLGAFLEGVQREAIPQQMLMTVQWSAITMQMEHCFKLCYEERSDAVDVEAVQLEGLSYFFLLKLLKPFDHSNAVIQPVMASVPRAVHFFDVRTGYVEIFRDERVERIFFPLPAPCIPGGPLDQNFDMMYETEREDPDKKNQEYLENMCRLVENEEFHARIRRTFFSFTVNAYDNICTFTLAWAFLIHLLLVCGGYTPRGYKEDYVQLVQEEPPGEHDEYIATEVVPYVEETLRVMGYLFLLVCLVRCFSFAYAHLPVIVRELREEEEDDEESLQDPKNDDEGVVEEEELGGVLKVDENGIGEVHEALEREDEFDDDEEEEQEEEDPHKISLLGFWTTALYSGAFWYEFVFLLSAILAVGLDEPLYTCFALLEVCFWKGSKTVIDAIYFNMAKMVQTMILGLLVMYIWMIFGVAVLKQQQDDGVCTNMFQCFISYLTQAIRENGVADMLTDPEFPTNIVDALIGEQTILLRLAWDIAYQVLFLYILLAIITGIVIDAFGGLRDEKEAAENNLKQNCFVCNLDRFTLDQHGIGFDKHVRSEHNPRWYLFFLLYIKQKTPSLLNGQERFVFAQVWPAHGKRSYKWLPRETTASLVLESDDGADVSQRVSQVESKVDAVNASVERLQATLDGFIEATAGPGGRRRRASQVSLTGGA